MNSTARVRRVGASERGQEIVCTRERERTRESMKQIYVEREWKLRAGGERNIDKYGK